jgi:hypothetical protein
VIPAGPALFAAASAAAAAGLAVRRPGRRASPAEPRPRRRPRWVAPLSAGLAGWLLLGGRSGLLLGVGLAAVSWRVVARLPTTAEARTAARVRRDLPLTLDLLAGCLRAGATAGPAAAAVAAAVGEPLAPLLLLPARLLEIGAGPDEAWATWCEHPALGPAGRALCRSGRTGASCADLLADLAADARAAVRTADEQAVRTLAVRAVGPLGLCLLPAFVLVGVVPLVVSLFSRLR